jgi:putative heme-binding domain-containing protein
LSDIGPDLTGLALQYDRDEIIRSVLEPSSRIVNGYRPLVVALDDGSVATGLVRAETEDHLELIDPSMKPIRVSRSEIVERRLGEISPMPAGLVDGLSAQEFADLIAFLESLRDRRGVPDPG